MAVTWDLNPCDNDGHGSGTIGIMAGETSDKSEQIGVAPGSDWIACKGCEENSCSDLALTSCADWMVAPCPIGVDPGDPSCDPAYRPHIINNSWGGPGGDTWYQSYIQAWVAAGMFPAFSAGNTAACNALGSPGDNPEAFGTAAHAGNGENLYAGGPSIFYPNPSCDPNDHQIDPHLNAPTFGRTAGNAPGEYYNLSGTSGASPHTAGTVALIWEADPTYIGDILGTFYVLEQSTNHNVPIGDCGKPACAVEDWPNYEYGWGYLDALAAVDMVGATADHGWLEGHVYDLNSGNPIQGASVQAILDVPASTLGDNFIEEFTDPNGYYTMTLMAGTYTVTASATGYPPEEFSDVVIVSDATTTQDFYLSLPLGAWTPGPSPAPFEYNRFDGVFNPVDGWIYFPGGRTGGSGHDKSIWSYDPRNDVWEDTTCDMLYNASNFTAVYIEDDGTGRGEVIYIIGGYDPVGAVNIDDVQRYYPSHRQVVWWRIFPQICIPIKLRGQVVGANGVAEVDGKIYVFGGWESTVAPYFSDKTWVFDPLAPAGTRWTQITDATLMPARSYIQTAVQNGLIYAMGGIDYYDGSELDPTTVVEVFDPANPAAGWQSLAPMPVASAEGRGFGFDVDTLKGIQQPWTGKLYVVGGGDWSDQSAEVMEYDVATNTWNQAFPDLISARRDHAGTFVPLCTSDPNDGLPGMWVFGGNIGADDPPFGDPEFYPFPMECPADIVVEAPPLEAGVFPDQMATLEFSIRNIGGESLDWSLHEMSPTVRLAGQIAPLSTEPRGREISLEIVGAPGGSVQAGPWEPAGSIELVLDDGTVETAIGIGGTWEFIYLNRFTPDEADFPFYIEEVSVYFPAFGLVQVGDEMILTLYENTSGNPDPAVGSNYLASFPVTVQELNTWNSYMLPTPIYYFGPGDVLVGVVALETPGTSYWPAALDTTASQQRSWAGWWLDSPPPDPPLLPPDDTWMMIDVFMAGNWMIRGSGTTIDIVDIPWLSEDPITGTVDAGGEQIVTVTFDSAGLSAGDYFANLVILSNDPDTPMYTLPVTMTVFAAAVDIDTLTPAQSGDPGATVTYTLQVANLGDAEDTFDITASGLWTTTVLDPVVTLPPSGVADVMVAVEIPLDAMAGDSDMATITATSQGDPTVSDTVDLTTTANQVYGVELTPETDAMLGAPGERVEYTLTLMNTGNGPDTYEIAYSGNTWNVHLPVELVMVDAGDSVAVIVHVDIPAGAADGDFDVADITATSVGDDTVSASSELTTTAVVEGYMVYLPTVFK
jgi:hypothetical protein